MGSLKAFKLESPSVVVKKPRPRNLIFDTLVEVCQFAPGDIGPVASRIGKAAAALKEFPLEEIRRRAENHKKVFNWKPLTPWSIADNWPLLAGVPPPKVHPVDQILQLRQKIRDSRAFAGGPYYVSCHTDLEASQMKVWREDLLKISPMEDFSLLRE